MADCLHMDILRFDADPPGRPLWACADCRLRFYPHGPECNRGCTHEALLTVREAAQLLNVHINTIRRLGDRGDLPFHRIGMRGDRRIPTRVVTEYLRRRSI